MAKDVILATKGYTSYKLWSLQKEKVIANRIW